MDQREGHAEGQPKSDSLAPPSVPASPLCSNRECLEEQPGTGQTPGVRLREGADQLILILKSTYNRPEICRLFGSNTIFSKDNLLLRCSQFQAFGICMCNSQAHLEILSLATSCKGKQKSPLYINTAHIHRNRGLGRELFCQCCCGLQTSTSPFISLHLSFPVLKMRIWYGLPLLECFETKKVVSTS